MRGEIVAKERSLVDQGEDCRLIWGNNRCISSSTTGSKIVGIDRSIVELSDVVANPIGAVVSGVAGKGWVTKRVGKRRLGPCDIEAGLRVAVSTAKDLRRVFSKLFSNVQRY